MLGEAICGVGGGLLFSEETRNEGQVEAEG